MVEDVLLQAVRKAFASLAAQNLRPLLIALMKSGDRPEIQIIIRQLLLLQWRSEDVLSEFAGFYCVRLLLDYQSPLATYFIDLFCQLECLLEEFINIAAGYNTPLPPVTGRGRSLLWHVRHDTEWYVRRLLCLVRPVTSTCRLLYVAYMILPRSEAIQDWEEQLEFWRDEIKLKARHGRQFWRNQMHCRIRELGLTNLDQPGKPMIKCMEVLGEGAFAKVYKGLFEDVDRRKIIGRPQAVKMFSSASSNVDGGGSKSNFGIQLLQSMAEQPGNPLRDELHRLVSVKHPNIVTPRGYIGKRPQGDGGLVMELMDESLDDYLEKVNNGSVPRLEELDMLDFMLEIAKGMRFLHECNLIHRDLKPQNVLLRFCADEDLGCKLFEVKLADFGLTKLLDQFDGGTVSRHTTFRGTSCYMAPEVRGNSTHEELAFPEKVDVFSFGTTCFNILIGNPDACAFSKTSGAFYEAVRTGKWKTWMQNEHLQYLVKLIGKCWETDPAMRPTFATICLLLQHAMQCHVSAQSLCNALSAARAVSIAQDLSNMQVFDEERWKHPALYGPMISAYILEGQDSVIGLREVTEWLLKFKSASGTLVYSADYDNIHYKMRKRFPGMSQAEINEQTMFILSGLVCNKDVDDAAESRDDAAESTPLFKCTFQLLESCLDKPDPLIFMKGLPFHNLAKWYFEKRHLYIDLAPGYEKPQFNFTGDEAYSELVVDTSLIPLLLTFWTNPYLSSKVRTCYYLQKTKISF